MANKTTPKKNGMVGTPRGYVSAKARDRVDKSMSSAASKVGKTLLAPALAVYGDQSVARSKLNITKSQAKIRKIAEEKARRMKGKK